MISYRVIQGAVAKVKEQAPKEPFPLTPWRSRANKEETPENTRYLLRLHNLKREEGGAGLYAHEAKWALRLQGDLEGLEPLRRQLELIQIYAQRESAAYYLNATTYTEDLDGFVAHQMWLSPEHQQLYEEVIAAGAVPIPFLGITEPFLRELLAQGPDKVGEEVWDRLDHDPIFHVFRQLLNPSEDTMPSRWSNILLDFLDDPTGEQPVN